MTDIQPSQNQARAASDRTSTMLPRMTASDERDERRNRAAKRRREGIAFTADEARADLRDALETLLSRIALYRANKSTFLQTPAQMLAYAEHVAAFIIRDYPREIGEDATHTALWDAFDRIHTGPYAWRNGECPYGAAASIIVSIEHTALFVRAKTGSERPGSEPPAIEIDEDKPFNKPIRRFLPGFD